MSDLKARFTTAAQEVQKLKSRPSSDNLLQLYALYKQADAGNVVGDRPGVLDVVGRAKYDAWSKLKGVSRDEAMRNYVALVGKLKGQEVTA